MQFYFYYFKDFIYLFLERGEGREKERERNIDVWLPLTCPSPGTWPATQECALTGNQTGDSLIHRPALNPLRHTSQGSHVMLKQSYLLRDMSQFLELFLLLFWFILLSGLKGWLTLLQGTALVLAGWHEDRKKHLLWWTWVIISGYPERFYICLGGKHKHLTLILW